MLVPVEHHRVRLVLDVLPTAHRPLLVLAENGEQYYLKYTQHQLYELQCEWLCHFLLREGWGVSTPDVALLTVPQAVRQALPAAAQFAGRYLADPCFGSRSVADAIDSSDFIQHGTTAEVDLLTNPDDILWIALFDAWVSNDDRRASHHNLLLAPDASAGRGRLRCWAIDHAFTFTSQSFQALDYKETYFSYNTNLVQANAARAVLRRWRRRSSLLWAEELKEGYYLRVEKCRQQFLTVCNLIPAPYQLTAADQTSLFYFLFCKKRLEALWDEFFASLPL